MCFNNILCVSCLKEDLRDPLWDPNQPQCQEFPYNTWKLTNVSIWRNQATNRPLSPGDIPDVRPWQPGLREAQRFCLTAVSLSLVLLRAGLTASHGGDPYGLCLGEEGEGWGELISQHNVVQSRTRNWPVCRTSKQGNNLINEPDFLFTLSRCWQLKDIFTGQCQNTNTVLWFKFMSVKQLLTISQQPSYSDLFRFVVFAWGKSKSNRICFKYSWSDGGFQKGSVFLANLLHVFDDF